jgi:gluconolactonase
VRPSDFTDARKDRIMTINLDGKISLWKQGANGSHGIAYAPDGRLYAGQHDRKRIVAFSLDGKESAMAEGMQTHHLTVSARGRVYFAVAPAHQVWMMDAGGQARVVHEGLEWPRNLCVSPDQARLIVNDARSTSLWSFPLRADGSLAEGKVAYRVSEADAGGIAFDAEGFLYVATKAGVEVFDRSGRALEKIAPPTGEGLSNLFFAGRRLQWLYVTDGDKMWRRQMNRRGARRY